jgi:hypothetical protein
MKRERTIIKSDPEKLVMERGTQHGDWKKQAAVAQCFKRLVRDSLNYQTGRLMDSQLEAVEMICVKLSRILTGNPWHKDHWLDIQGYAQLGMKDYD